MSFVLLAFAVETAFTSPQIWADMVAIALENLDPVFLGLLVIMLLFVFFAYLFVRRTMLGLREGYEQARDRR